jgi:hypothetical protein
MRLINERNLRKELKKEIKNRRGKHFNLQERDDENRESGSSKERSELDNF